jgi:hypothetical protein
MTLIPSRKILTRRAVSPPLAAAIVMLACSGVDAPRAAHDNLVPRDILVGTWSSADATLAAQSSGARLIIPCIAIEFPTLRLDDALTFRATGVVTRAGGLVTVRVGDPFQLSGRVIGDRVVIPWPWIVLNSGQDTLVPSAEQIRVCNA